MPRVIGVDVPGNKRLVISLTYIYGVGLVSAQKIVDRLKLDPNMRARHLNDGQIAQLNALLSSEYMVEGDLRRRVHNHIKRLMMISSYRGIRHRSGLPVRGQRTRCNARTRKGRRKTVAGKKSAPGPG